MKKKSLSFYFAVFIFLTIFSTVSAYRNIKYTRLGGESNTYLDEIIKNIKKSSGDIVTPRSYFYNDDPQEIGYKMFQNTYLHFIYDDDWQVRAVGIIVDDPNDYENSKNFGKLFYSTLYYLFPEKDFKDWQNIVHSLTGNMVVSVDTLLISSAVFEDSGEPFVKLTFSEATDNWSDLQP